MAGASPQLALSLIALVGTASWVGCDERHDERESLGDTDPHAERAESLPPTEPNAVSSPRTANGTSSARHVELTAHAWEKVFTADAKEPEIWLASLWVSETDTLYIGGSHGVTVIAPNSSLPLSSTEMGDVMLDIWGASDAEVYAVGGRGTVARYDGAEWSIERKPGRRAHRSAELLHSVGFFLDDSTVTAFGPSSSLKRSGGQWVALTESEDRRVRERWGGSGRLPSPCATVGVETWLADRHGHEWIQCRDRRTYWLQNDLLVAHSMAPRECNNAFRVLFFQDALHVTCGGVLFRNVGSDWQKQVLAEDVGALVATHRCLFALGRRTVFRTCP